MKMTSAPTARDHPNLRLHQGLLVAKNLRRAGKLNEAQAVCERLIAECPDFVGALQVLGWIHYSKRRYEQALSCFIRANMYNPDNHETLNYLANIYLKLDAGVAAAQALERALELEPDDANVQQTLGNIQWVESEYELAAQSYRMAMSLKPHSLATAHGLARCCIQLGLFEEAAVALGKAHEISPQSHKVLFSMSLLPPAFVKIDLLAALEHCRLQDREDPKEFDNINRFTRAIALSRVGRCAEAWNLLVKANRELKVESASTDQQRRERREGYLRLAEAFVPVSGTGERNSAPISLFILGPSRSGKTTVELLAGSLPGVKRGYENRTVGNAVARSAQLAGFPTIRKATAMLPAMEPAFLEAYRRELQQRAQGAGVFTNTNPVIILDVGRLSALLPEARFLFVLRNIDDIALRIFMKRYDAGNEYGYNLKDIHAYIAWYHRMADVWAQKLPGTSLTLNYDDVIADPNADRAQIAGLLGLPAPRGDVPQLGDDRGCAGPYKAYMDAELSA